MSFDAAPQLIVNGLITGSLYALAAVSFGLIFSTTKTFHFAHAISFTAGAYTVVVADDYFPLAVAAAAGIVVAGAFGAVVELLLYRRLRARNAGTLQIFLAALGVLSVGEATVHILFGPDAHRLNGVPSGNLSFGSVSITAVDVLIAGVAAVVVVGFLVALHRSRGGIVIRGVSANPRLSSVIGADPRRTYLVVFIVGSALAGLAGVLFAARDVATPAMGLDLVLAAAIGVFVGGIGSYRGAVLGGLTLGLAESLGGIVLPGHLNSIVAFALLFVVIIFKPSGFYGRRVTLSGRGA